jgi:DNA invertase Pin-like site-specific DNA recombinase
MKTAYSYLRFSAPAQAEGDSRRRQTEPAKAWCARNKGYALDDTLRDEGRSAFRGSNAKGRRSALAGFLLKIDLGLVRPGSVLILENLDRLSRQQIDKSLDLAKRILKAGVDIVTLLPERRYTAASLNNLQERLELEFTFHRAHEESKVKSDRLKEKWAQRRLAMREKKVVSRRLPFWISVVDGGFVLNDKAAWVRHAFKMAAEGRGYVQIVKHFNQQGWKVRRADTIDRHLIRNLLRNRQVIGEYQPRVFHGVGDRPLSGEPIPGYFPEAVTPALFRKAQAVLDTRKITGRGRPSPGAVTNLFQGLVFDVRDGGPCYATKKAKVRNIAPWNAMQGKPGSTYYAFRYDPFERAILGVCRQINPSLVVPPSDVDQDIADCEAELAEAAAKVVRAKERLARAKDAETEEVVTEQLAGLRRHQKELEKRLDELKTRKTTQPAEQLAKLHTLIDALATAEDKDKVRTLIRALIGSLVSRINVYIQAKGHKQRRCWGLVQFKTGLFRKILIMRNNTVCLPDEDPTMSVPEGDGWK